MKPRKPLPPRRAYLKRSGKRIPPINLRQARRKADDYAEMLRSPEYRAARAEAMQRARNRCEDKLPDGSRCHATEDLEAHHERYTKVGEVKASDLSIKCPPHHRKAESAFPWRVLRRRYLATVEGKR